MIQIKGKKARVCIDPGHGGHDPGAVGPTGLKEDETALKFAKELMYALDLLGIDSELTRTEDVGLQLSERVAASKDCNCFISIHCNAATPQAEGIETVFSSKAGLHKALANYVQQSMIKHFPGHKNRGIKMSPSMDYPRSLYVLSNAAVPACLVEVEFISHPSQEKFLAAEETVGQVGNALAEAIKSFFLSLPDTKEIIDVEVHDKLASAKAIEKAQISVSAATPVVEAKTEAVLESPKVQDKIPMKKKNKKT